MRWTNSNLLRISLQFFAADTDGTGGADASTNTTADNTSTVDTTASEAKSYTTEELERMIQREADRRNAKSGKEVADLRKELDKLKRSQMDAEEVRKLELQDKEAELATREQALKDSENRLAAIKAIKKAGLDDGGDTSLELVNFVMADTPEQIEANVKAFGALVQKFVKVEVDKLYAKAADTPKGAGAGAASKTADTSVAAELGAARAEQQKKSADVLSYYIKGGRK